MAKYSLTNKAVEDLGKIWNYTFENWSESQADKYYNALLDKCKEIGSNPDLGSNIEGVTKSLYAIRINRHIIFYRRLEDDRVEVARILHEKMDLKRRIIKYYNS